MAEDPIKKSTIVYHDALEVVNKMPDEMAGKFIKILLKIMKGEDPQIPDLTLELTLHPFIKQIKRDAVTYKKVCGKNRLNGAKGGRPPKTQPNPKNPSGSQKTQPNPKEPKKPDNDNGTENDNGNYNDKGEKEHTAPNDDADDCPIKGKGRGKKTSPSWTNQIKEIIDYLNSSLKKNFKPDSELSQRHIKARLREGFTVAELKKVVDIKISQWENTKWEKFLRPATLFGPKCESYLQEKKKETSQWI